MTPIALRLSICLPIALTGCQWIADIDRKARPDDGSGAGGATSSSSISSTAGAGAGGAASSGAPASSSSSAGGGEPCPTICHGVCVDVLGDRANCGACDNNCGAGVKCDEGVCGRALFRGSGSDAPSITKADGSLWAFGADAYCNAGLGGAETASLFTPTRAALFAERVRYAAATPYTMCALLASNGVACVGANETGQVGNGHIGGEGCGTTTAVPYPFLTLASGVEEIAGGGWYLGGSHFCARMTDGKVSCWGDAGSDCIKAVLPTPLPLRVDGVDHARALAVGDGFACAITSSNTVRCWGSNCNGELGQNDLEPSTTAVEVPGLSGVTAIAAGLEHVCVRAQDGLYCWGYNNAAQLGDGSGVMHATTPRRVTAVPGLVDVVQLAAGYVNTCALTAAGTVYCWGASINDAIGSGDLQVVACPEAGIGECVVTPTKALISDVVEIALGDSNVLARRRDGSVWSWGSSSFGALGLGQAYQAVWMPTPLPGFP